MSASTEFWAEQQVGGPYQTVEESSLALRERLIRYSALLELMPVNYPGKAVLDYGCGPGHDTILFSQLGADVSYYDTSDRALATTQQRLRLHGLPGHRLHHRTWWIPADGWPGFDHIHCAGVLHHTENPDEILAQLARLLKPGGEIRLMVYDGHRSTHTQSQVPITHWWTSDDIHAMAAAAGLYAQHEGSYECSADWRPGCWAACYRLWHSR